MSDVPVDLALIRGATQRLGEAIPALLDVDKRPEPAVELLATVRDLRKGLADLEAWLEAECVVRLPKKRQQVGEYVAEVKGGQWSRAHWNHPNAFRDVCQDLIYDQDTGAPIEEVAQIVALVLERVLKAAHIDYWRAEDLRAAGLNPDSYCDQVQGRRTVHVVPAIEAEETPAAGSDAA